MTPGERIWLTGSIEINDWNSWKVRVWKLRPIRAKTKETFAYGCNSTPGSNAIRQSKNSGRNTHLRLNSSTRRNVARNKQLSGKPNSQRVKSFRRRFLLAQLSCRRLWEEKP